MIHVRIYEPGGVVATVPTDFVTASRLVRAAKLRGVEAVIVPWTRYETRTWRETLDRLEAITVAVGVCEGTCKCTLRPTGESILCLVPFGVEVQMADGNSVMFQRESPAIPQGTAEPAKEAEDA